MHPCQNEMISATEKVVCKAGGSQEGWRSAVRIEWRVKHIPFDQETWVRIHCETKHHWSFFENLNKECFAPELNDTLTTCRLRVIQRRVHFGAWWDAAGQSDVRKRMCWMKWVTPITWFPKNSGDCFQLRDKLLKWFLWKVSWGRLLHSLPWCLVFWWSLFSSLTCPLDVLSEFSHLVGPYQPLFSSACLTGATH